MAGPWLTLPEVLARFESVPVDAAALFALLPPLKPRLYSISSAPAALPGAVSLTVAVVRAGFCSGSGVMSVGEGQGAVSLTVAVVHGRLK